MDGAGASEGGYAGEARVSEVSGEGRELCMAGHKMLVWGVGRAGDKCS